MVVHTSGTHTRVVMKLAILSRAPRSYSTQRLRTAALDRGHTVKVLNTLRFGIDLSGDEPDLQFRGKQLSHYDAILPRIGNSITYFGTAVVRQFEQMDVYTPNTSWGIANSRDKLRATQILSRHQIGMPATTFVQGRGDVIPAIERVGGAPVVIKLLEGTQGIGVILAPDIKVAEAIIETLQSTRQNVLIQRFVKESKGRDIRALVVGDRVVAAMRRVAQGDEFRSNVHRGGSVEPVDLDPAFERAAVRSAQIMGLRVAGVDMLEGNDGPLVMEVNSSPGLEGIERATDLDVAGAIIDYIDNQVAFPEIDVDPAPRHPGHPQPQCRPRAGGRRPVALLRQARGDALDDPEPSQADAQAEEAARRADPRRLRSAAWGVPRRRSPGSPDRTAG